MKKKVFTTTEKFCLWVQVQSIGPCFCVYLCVKYFQEASASHEKNINGHTNISNETNWLFSLYCIFDNLEPKHLEQSLGTKPVIGTADGSDLMNIKEMIQAKYTIETMEGASRTHTAHPDSNCQQILKENFNLQKWFEHPDLTRLIARIPTNSPILHPFSSLQGYSASTWWGTRFGSFITMQMTLQRCKYQLTVARRTVITIIIAAPDVDC